MRLFDFRLTLCGANFFLRLFCQYPDTFYYLMVSTALPQRELFSLCLERRSKQSVGAREWLKIIVPVSGE